MATFTLNGVRLYSFWSKRKAGWLIGKYGDNSEPRQRIQRNFEGNKRAKDGSGRFVTSDHVYDHDETVDLSDGPELRLVLRKK